MRNRATLWWIGAALIVGLFADYSFGYALKCDRIPEGAGAAKTPVDGRFRIRIEGNIERYTPSEVYTIHLAGIRSMQTTHKFTGFMLAAEKENYDPMNDVVGSFDLVGDTLTKFSDRCPNLVTHTSSIPKTEIQVRWTAPPPGSGCVIFRATVIEHRDVWYMDDDPLNKKFCEEEQDTIDSQPRIESQCCACQEAKYEVTFEGLWSRHTHPKDYPSNRWLTRFSDIIGASHSIEYRFWEYGKPASEGLQQVAEHGSTLMLESELKSQSDQIRTIIKARGISYPNVTGKTFAVFRVDSTHHLVSLVSMIDPSPDWIVGVSGLELCLPNCTWIEQKMLNLFPWDAGTDSGPSYTSPDQPTNPKDVIRRIKSTFPNDPRSPFYEPNGQDMKPMARIYFTRQRLYDKNCESQSSDDGNCATHPWGAYGPCSVSCGKGYKSRHREYVDRTIGSQNCNKRLTEQAACEETRCHTYNTDTNDDTNEVDPECVLSPWSNWSECSKKCGRGHRVRTRRYKYPNAAKRCQAAFPNELLEQTDSCEGEHCGGNLPTEEPPQHRPRNGQGTCKMHIWTNWSPCDSNVYCGRKIRYSYPLNRGLDPVEVQRRATLMLNLMNYNEVPYAPVQNHRRYTAEPVEEHELMRSDCDKLFCFPPNDACAEIEFLEISECEEECNNIPKDCLLDPDVGNCREPKNRWYFDRRERDCGVFAYGGCNGNNNNRFNSLDECRRMCRLTPPQFNERNTSFFGERGFNGMSIQNQRRLDGVSRNNEGPRDCIVSGWQRGNCNTTCGEGMRQKSRRIISHPDQGGKRCPKILIKFETCHVPCDSRYDTNPSWGPAQGSRHCQYSEWSSWSPCSRSCGEYSVQTRHRTVITARKGFNCPDRLEERRCNVMPCD